MGVELLLEIGTEEIPASYLEPGLADLKRLSEACLRENRVSPAGKIRVCGTPRRLVLIGEGIAGSQEDITQEITGPPKSMAFDAQGNPTKAALGFAERQDVSVEELGILKTPRGEYVCLKRHIPGRPTSELLAEFLPHILANISWPKSMRWGNIGFSFVRPIQWIVALFDGEIIPFEVAGVRSGRVTQGHRFMAPERFEVTGVNDYLERMAMAYVIVDPEDRKNVVKEAVEKAAATVRGKPADDPELVSIVANLAEYPTAVYGSFEQAFLELPDPVLITAMKEHQRYFAVYHETGGLMPHFVAVNNTVARDESLVRRGYERVLRARLSDADFFFREDRKRPLIDRTEDLKGVIYQTDLGTSYAKVMRFTRLTEFICQRVLPQKIEHVRLSAQLCKCDLVTHMVTEFPTLQGVMGREYARMDGHPEEVCIAISEHYLPVKADGELPESVLGAIVGISDRMDTIVGCFAVGLEPSGAADPFALRRHALAIIRILEQKGWDLSLEEILREAISLLEREITFDGKLIFGKVLGFFRERYKQRILRSGYDSELVDAVMEVGFDHISQLGIRIEHLKRFTRESKDFHSLALTFKRIANILKKEEQSFDVHPELFKADCESALWNTYQSLKHDVHCCLMEKDYYGALNCMRSAQKPVEDLFDGVEILTKESRALRENRLALLQRLAELFFEVADLSKFSI